MKEISNYCPTLIIVLTQEYMHGTQAAMLQLKEELSKNSLKSFKHDVVTVHMSLRSKIISPKTNVLSAEDLLVILFNSREESTNAKLK